METPTDQLPHPIETEPPFLTRVETLFLEGRCNYRLIFGHPLKVVQQEFEFNRITRKHAFFKPGDIFALDLWDRNAYGTTKWAVYVLQAAGPDEASVPVPQVEPAAKVLVEAVGKEHAQVALRVLKEIEERTDPTTLSPNRFLLTDFRIKAAIKYKRWGLN
jgi:hypothetical protein